jgi:hypothetical protein
MITGRWAGAGIIEKSDEDIYEYGLELLLYTILNTVVILGSAALVGKIAESLALLLVIMSMVVAHVKNVFTKDCQ